MICGALFPFICLLNSITFSPKESLPGRVNNSVLWKYIRRALVTYRWRFPAKSLAVGFSRSILQLTRIPRGSAERHKTLQLAHTWGWNGSRASPPLTIHTLRNWTNDGTHQADKDEDELKDVCVRHRIQPSQQGVDDGYHWGHDDGVDVGQVQYHTHRSTWNNRAEGWGAEHSQGNSSGIQALAATDTCNCFTWHPKSFSV